MEPTSEQELKQLLEEGKITEEEYQELLEAIRQKEATQQPVEKPTESKPRTGYGKAALTLMTASIVLPVVAVLMALVLNAVGAKVGSKVLLVSVLPIGLSCTLLAFIFGIIGWKTTQGKIAAIGVPCLGLLIVPGFMILSLFYVRAKSTVAVEQQRAKIEELGARHLVSHKAYPLDSLDGVLAQDGIELDNVIFADGNGSLRFFTNSSEKTVVRLFETGPMGIDNRMLIYSAKVKSELDNGIAYLEMWCDIPGKGAFFSRGLAQPVSGSTNWTTVQTAFQLEAGQMPGNVKLNLVIEGVGTVWIDDIKLLSSPLN